MPCSPLNIGRCRKQSEPIRIWLPRIIMMSIRIVEIIIRIIIIRRRIELIMIIILMIIVWGKKNFNSRNHCSRVVGVVVVRNNDRDYNSHEIEKQSKNIDCNETWFFRFPFVTQSRVDNFILRTVFGWLLGKCVVFII